MTSHIKLKNVSLDFPIYEGADFSFRNKISSFGRLSLNKGKDNKVRRVVRGLDN